MKTKTRDRKSGYFVAIDPFHFPSDTEMDGIITVRQHINVYTNTWQLATVSWSAIGNVTVADAVKFNDSLKFAIEFAQGRNYDFYGKPVKKKTERENNDML